MSDEELLCRYLVPLARRRGHAGRWSSTTHVPLRQRPRRRPLVDKLLRCRGPRSPMSRPARARSRSVGETRTIRGRLHKYEFDTPLDPDYPVLTRGNAGEIMPDIVSPLSATVFFPPLERGWRRSFTETWDVMAWPTCPTTFAPIVGGRFYINISAFRRLADLTPGTSPDDIDRTLFAAGGIKLDPYEPPDEPGYASAGRTYRRGNCVVPRAAPASTASRRSTRRPRTVERTAGRIVSHEARASSCWRGSCRSSRRTSPTS